MRGRHAAHNAVTLCVYSGRPSLRHNPRSVLNGDDDTYEQITQHRITESLQASQPAAPLTSLHDSVGVSVRFRVRVVLW